LDALVEHGNGRRARTAVMDVVVVLALLDEIDRLKEAFIPRPVQSKQEVGPIPAEKLSSSRTPWVCALGRQPSLAWVMLPA
jgi:hypothetical protein